MSDIKDIIAEDHFNEYYVGHYVDVSPRTRLEPLFRPAPRHRYKTTHGNACHVEHLHLHSWHDLEPRVAEMAGTGSRSNPHQYAARQRSNGALLGVWVAAQRTYRHPDFQFDAHNAIRPAVAELLKVLPGDEEDKNGWRRAFWLYSPHPLLSGETPADVFVRNPQRVIETAREEFCGDANAHW